ncbi:MAG: hypothetical protein OES46_05365 [Gammaproteobacteria bacterium]|nr:hypothetical protein [Gammaproteobacteria bacterium]
MTSRTLWLGIVVLYYGALIGAQVAAPGLFLWTPVNGGISSFHWIYVLAFFGLGVLLLGIVGRTFAGLGPISWRVLALCLGAGLALVHLSVGRVTTGSPLSIDMFMSALLGLALAVLSARLLPASMVQRWQGR